MFLGSKAEEKFGIQPKSTVRKNQTASQRARQAGRENRRRREMMTEVIVSEEMAGKRVPKTWHTGFQVLTNRESED
jgi:hypothetical protein